MRIAIPTNENMVDDHFGHCRKYVIFNINEDKTYELMEILPSPEGCGCKSNIANILHERGVKLLLAGSMGEGAKQILNSFGIQVIRGCSGNILDLVEAFTNQLVKDSGKSCSHNDHTCTH